MQGSNIEEIFSYVLNNIYRNGPTSIADMEILSYLALYQPERFSQYKDSILMYMGVFYKELSRQTLKDVVFGQYKKYIIENYGKSYTPVQANIVKEIKANNCFSFSAPTSTGKSFVFMNQILQCEHDVIVVVPSRALINEYYLKLCELIRDKTVNVLTFIDKINTAIAKRNVFIVTPERCRELFRQREEFFIDLFLFDEAQLSNEDSKRGLYFDSIVRRCQKAYPDAKFVFAHPFVLNPNAQIEKNHFNVETSDSIQYKQKNVGQIFMCVDERWNFYHFGIEKEIMGSKKIESSFDPIKKTLDLGGSVLFYISKSKIYSREFVTKFSQYIELCQEIQDSRINIYIDALKQYTGGDTAYNRDYYSQMIALMKKGIVIHHGSLPLQARIIIEQFTRAGYCKICFATSTLEQGINMPFDIVYLDRLEGSKPLSVKNIIGRAGRSTEVSQFDYGFVIIGVHYMSKFRQLMTQDETLDNVSSLEKDNQHDDDYNEFREAIINDTFSDKYNLTEKELSILTSVNLDRLIKSILDTIFVNGQLISQEDINKDTYNKLQFYDNLSMLYSKHIGRELTDAERYVLNTAIKIMIWRVHGKTFKKICWYRYSYASQTRERKRLQRQWHDTDSLEAKFITGFHDIPDKNLKVYGLFKAGTKAKDVDYDIIMYDTYDYIDKLISFKLSDVFYAVFFKYYERSNDMRSLRLAKYIKYGTDNERYIWMLRYGLSFEDIEILDGYIESIDERAIVFKETIANLSDEQRSSIVRYL
jgi:superfamily II DNA/RNA helicase